MQKIFALALALLIHAQAQPAHVITQDFSANPNTAGWEFFGPSNLIRWNSENQNLEVTWDSSQPNHFLRLPLQTILQRNDDFSVSLDLLLHDFAAGVNPAKPGTFQIAFGFHNHADSSSPNFQRAAQNKSPNLVEFNFMPDTGFGPTIWPAVFSTNGAMNYSGATDFNIFNLPTSVPMQITLAYNGAAETATISIRANGQPVGPDTIAHLATNDVAFGKAFTQFKVDSFAIASYSDAGNNGSLLAHGVIDNIRLTLPPPAISDVTGQFTSNTWRVTFNAQANFHYTLQSTTNFSVWQNVSTAPGHTGPFTLADNQPTATAFYRISAERLD